MSCFYYAFLAKSEIRKLNYKIKEKKKKRL